MFVRVSFSTEDREYLLVFTRFTRYERTTDDGDNGLGRHTKIIGSLYTASFRFGEKKIHTRVRIRIRPLTDRHSRGIMMA